MPRRIGLLEGLKFRADLQDTLPRGGQFFGGIAALSGDFSLKHCFSAKAVGNRGHFGNGWGSPKI